MKFGTGTYFVMLQKKMVEKNFQNCSYKDDEVTNSVIFLKNYTKNG